MRSVVETMVAFLHFLRETMRFRLGAWPWEEEVIRVVLSVEAKITFPVLDRRLRSWSTSPLGISSKRRDGIGYLLQASQGAWITPLVQVWTRKQRRTRSRKDLGEYAVTHSFRRAFPADFVAETAKNAPLLPVDCPQRAFSSRGPGLSPVHDFFRTVGRVKPAQPFLSDLGYSHFRVPMHVLLPRVLQQLKRLEPDVDGPGQAHIQQWRDSDRRHVRS